VPVSVTEHDLMSDKVTVHPESQSPLLIELPATVLVLVIA
jgi:hypothetical protein